LSQNSARIGPIWGIPAETFFGVKKHVSKGLKQPMDAYDFFYETYARASKDKLLEFMAGWPNIEAMKSLSQQELAKRFSAQLAQTMWQQFVPKNTIEPPS
jgi:hypothetical protein